MDQELYQGRSFYFPRAFYISIRPEYLGENGDPLPKHLPVFMHEYSHLIQDSTTCYGAISFIHFYDRQMELSQLISSEKRNGNLTLPLKGAAYKKYSWLKIQDMTTQCHDPRKEWDGSCYWAFEAFEDPVFYFSPYLTSTGQKHDIKIPRVLAKFVDNVSGKSISHPIGVREIKESYSQAVENIHNGFDAEWKTGSEFQYFAINRILSKIFACEVSNEQLIAICHWSLQDIHPAENFQLIVNHIETQECGLPEWRQLYSLLRKRHLQVNGELKPSIDENFETQVANQCKTGEDDYLCRILKWYRGEILVNLNQIYDEASFFPLDSDFCKKNPNLTELTNKYPIWLYESANNGDVFSISKDEFASGIPFILRSIINIGEQVFSRKIPTYSCEWYKCCEKAKTKIQDSECHVRPWRKGLEKKTCPFGVASKYLQIENIDSFN